ncbi:GSU2403 family nucleotidyltransferase fold protein [Polaromonas sp. AET17H-212]|uniref:GSU2403 family nucleotidyltransferase fold protein n=1 Tax=Polaromonas sp. AET17H-212 TaxID=1977061 RepID=UPI000BBC3CF3|nr:GSU2403 family nucleotidyltransferase fold protein [Polaromonas sp. AET17H-212]
MTYALLEDDAIQQLAASAAAFDRHAAAVQTLQSRYSAEMSWQERDGILQLIKTQSDGREHSLGDQTDERVALHNKYLADQLAAKQALELSTKDLRVARGRNVSMGTARVPTIVIQILNELENKGLGGYYRVIGTHALYAYEVAAGVAFDAESTATRDVDLLWDVQQRIRLVANLDAAGLTMLQLLQLVDTSFERMEDQKESAVNAEGFAVDFLRRRARRQSGRFHIRQGRRRPPGASRKLPGIPELTALRTGGHRRRWLHGADAHGGPRHLRGLQAVAGQAGYARADQAPSRSAPGRRRRAAAPRGAPGVQRQAVIARGTSEGLSKKEIHRCRKRSSFVSCTYSSWLI